jgi:RNA polymerase sigma-70 factor (ECF subfamily)
MLLAIPLSATAEREFTEFCAATRVRTISLIALVTRDVHAAEDAAQEAYARAYARWPRVHALARPDLWVVRVGTNVAISNWKKTRRERDDLPEDMAHAASPETAIADELWMKWGLSTLSPKQRVAVVMHYAEGRTAAEVAAAMGAKEATVKTHLDRAKRRLRALLRPDVKQ